MPGPDSGKLFTQIQAMTKEATQITEIMRPLKSRIIDELFLLNVTQVLSNLVAFDLISSSVSNTPQNPMSRVIDLLTVSGPVSRSTHILLYNILQNSIHDELLTNFLSVPSFSRNIVSTSLA